MKMTIKFCLIFILATFTGSNIVFGNELSEVQFFEIEEGPPIVKLKKRLIHAINTGNLEETKNVIQKIESKNVFLTLGDERKETFLHWIARKEGMEKILDVHFVDYFTPYIINMLMQHRNKEGLNPRGLAKKLGNEKMLDSLNFLEQTVPSIKRYNFQDILEAVKDGNLIEYRRILRIAVPNEKSIPNGDGINLNYMIADISNEVDEKGNNIFHYFASVSNFKKEFGEELLSLMSLIVLNHVQSLNQALRRLNKEGSSPLDIALEKNRSTFNILIKGLEFPKYIFDYKNVSFNREDLKNWARQIFSNDTAYSSNEESKPIDFLKDMDGKTVLNDKTAVLQIFQDIASEPRDKVLEILKLQNNKQNSVFHMVARSVNSNREFMELVSELQQKSRISSVYGFLTVKNDKGHTPTDIAKMREQQCLRVFQGNKKMGIEKRQLRNKKRRKGQRFRQ